MNTISDKISATDRDNMNKLISELETSMKGENTDAIRTRMQELEGAWSGVFGQYQSTNQNQQTSGAGYQDTEQNTSSSDDDVVDAEFEEN